MKSPAPFILAISLLIFSLFTHSQTVLAQSAHEHGTHPHAPGGRMGLHGMVLYGTAGVYFLDHIPMEHAPHDFQIIAKVKLTTANGKIILEDFSNQSFTLKPESAFSLNDYIRGQLKAFAGQIHMGGFEQGGPVLEKFAQVQVEVLKLEFVQKLPATPTQNSIELSEMNDLFEVNIIHSQKNFQQVRNKKTGQILWCVLGPDFFTPCP